MKHLAIAFVILFALNTAEAAPSVTSGTQLIPQTSSPIASGKEGLWVKIADSLLHFQGAADVDRIVAFTSNLASYLPLAGGTMLGNLLFTDNTYDIGAAGATRPRTVYVGTSVNAPHIIGTGSTPTCVVGTAGGTVGQSCSIDGTDAAGTLTLTTGTSGWSGTQLVTVTFASAYANAPAVVLEWGNTVTSSSLQFNQWHWTDITGSNFIISRSAAYAAQTVLVIHYVVIGR